MTWNVNNNGYTVVQHKKTQNIQYKTMKIHILVNIRDKKSLIKDNKTKLEYGR